MFNLLIHNNMIHCNVWSDIWIHMHIKCEKIKKTPTNSNNLVVELYGQCENNVFKYIFTSKHVLVLCFWGKLFCMDIKNTRRAELSSRLVSLLDFRAQKWLENWKITIIVTRLPVDTDIFHPVGCIKGEKYEGWSKIRRLVQ